MGGSQQWVTHYVDFLLHLSCGERVALSTWATLCVFRYLPSCGEPASVTLSLTETLSNDTGKPERKDLTGVDQAVPYGDVSFIPSCRNPCAHLFDGIRFPHESISNATKLLAFCQ